MFLLLVLLLSLSTTLYITLLFYLFFVVCDGFAMAFCPFHSPGFGECAQIHLPRKVYFCVPRSGAPVLPKAARLVPSAAREGPGPLPPLPPGSVRDAVAASTALVLVLQELAAPAPARPKENRTAGKPAEGPCPSALPRQGVPPRHPCAGKRPCTRRISGADRPDPRRPVRAKCENPKAKPSDFLVIHYVCFFISRCVIFRRENREPVQ